MATKNSQSDLTSETKSETNLDLIISQHEPKQSVVLGVGRRRNEFHPDEHPEGTQRTSDRSQEKEINRPVRPDIEYQGLKIDLSPLEWVIVGIIAIVIYLLR